MKPNYTNEYSSAKVSPSAVAVGAFEVSHVHTDMAARKQGYATELMQSICADADVTREVLMLTAADLKLKVWYERFGFMQIQKQPIVMARMPHIFKVHMTPIAHAAKVLANG